MDQDDGGGIPRSHIGPISDAAIEQVIAGSLNQSTSRATRRTYHAALDNFARSVGKSPNEAVRLLLGSDATAAATVAREYKNVLLKAGLVPTTINLYLGRLRAIVDQARIAGLVSWKLEVDAVRGISGSGQNVISRAGYSDAVGAMEGDSPKALRDRAIMALIYELALRRREVASLDVRHVDFEHMTVSVNARSSEPRTARRISPETASVLRTWIERRGGSDGPLFVRLDYLAGARTRISLNSIWIIVKSHLHCTGTKMGPSGLRQSAMAHVIESLGIDLASAKRLSNERGPKTVLHPDSISETSGAMDL